MWHAAHGTQADKGPPLRWAVNPWLYVAMEQEQLQNTVRRARGQGGSRCISNHQSKSRDVTSTHTMGCNASSGAAESPGSSANKSGPAQGGCCIWRQSTEAPALASRRAFITRPHSALFFLFNVLFCSFLGPFCPDAKEPGVGTSHAETGKCLEVLLLLSDDSGFLLLVHLGGRTGSGHTLGCVALSTTKPAQVQGRPGKAVLAPPGTDSPASLEVRQPGMAVHTHSPSFSGG